MKSVGFGIVGLGGRAKSLASGILSLEGARLLGVCDLKDIIIKSFCSQVIQIPSDILKYTSFDEMLANPEIDVVVISTPDGLHAKMAIQAFEAGKHVFLEKPVGVNLDETLAIIQASQKANKYLQVGYQMRHLPFFKILKTLVDGGDESVLGRPLNIQVNENYFGGYHYFRSWWRFRKNVGGVMIQKICHDFEMLYYFFGEPVRVSCFGSNIEFKKGNAPKGSTALRCRDCPKDQHCNYHISDDETSSFKSDDCVYNADHDIMDNTTTLVQFQNGLVATLGMHFFPSKAQNSRFIKFTGSKSEIWGKVKDLIIRVDPRFDYSVNNHESYMIPVPDPPIVHARHLFADLIRGIQTGLRVEPGIASAYWSMILVLAAQRALDTQKVVEISEMTQEFPLPQ